MKPLRKVPTRYLVLLCDWLEKQGVDPLALLHGAGIDPVTFDRPDATLEPAAMEAFVANACHLSGRGDLGFELGRLIKMTSHDLLGYGMLSCRNFDEVLRLVARHYHLMTETFTLAYRRDPDGVGEAVYTPALAMPRPVFHFYLEALAVAHDNQLRPMLPSGPEYTYDIYVSMPLPAHLSRYQALIPPARFHFGEGLPPGIRVVMPPEVLEHPLPLADDRVVKAIDKRCRDLPPRPASSRQDWVGYLRMVLRHAEGDVPTLESIAQMNCVSPRTIERHLRRENLSFRGLLHQARFERACELLENPLASVANIAQRLGFSDAANFSRAFRRAIGATPTAYRQRAREAATGATPALSTP